MDTTPGKQSLVSSIELERRRKISETLKKRYADGSKTPYHWIGKRHTAETKRKIGDASRRWWKVTDTTETRRKIGLKSKGRIKGGHLHPAWKGGRFRQAREGYVYVYVPDHPFARRNTRGGGGYVLEHRLVMEKIVGRYLNPDEDVNHINGIKDDNRPENLMIVRHNAHYTPMCCPKCNFEFWVR